MAANHLEQEEFFKKINQLATEKQIGYIDAVLLYCEIHDIEITVAAELTNMALKVKLEENASSLNLLKKQKKLF